MKFPKTTVIIAAAMSMLIPQTSYAKKGEKSFGVKTGYISRNKSALAGIYFQYGFSEHFRLAPDAQCVFRHDNRDAFMIDLDAQFPFSFSGSQDRVALYPLAGINYTSWNRHLTKEEIDTDDDVTTRDNQFGLNMGAGFEFKATSSLKLSIEARYSLVKANSSLQISLGIGYVF